MGWVSDRRKYMFCDQLKTFEHIIYYIDYLRTILYWQRQAL